MFPFAALKKAADTSCSLLVFIFKALTSTIAWVISFSFLPPVILLIILALVPIATTSSGSKGVSFAILTKPVFLFITLSRTTFWFCSWPSKSTPFFTATPIVAPFVKSDIFPFIEPSIPLAISFTAIAPLHTLPANNLNLGNTLLIIPLAISFIAITPLQKVFLNNINLGKILAIALLTISLRLILPW